MADDLKDAIKENAEAPKSAESDGLRITQHDPTQVIAADQHLAGKAGAAKAHRGLRFTKLIPPGATG